MSAVTNLAGLYPPKGGDIWDAQLPWQPIPVHTTPAEVDHVSYPPPLPFLQMPPNGLPLKNGFQNPLAVANSDLQKSSGR